MFCNHEACISSLIKNGKTISFALCFLHQNQAIGLYVLRATAHKNQWQAECDGMRRVVAYDVWQYPVCGGMKHWLGKEQQSSSAALSDREKETDLGKGNPAACTDKKMIADWV